MDNLATPPGCRVCGSAPADTYLGGDGPLCDACFDQRISESTGLLSCGMPPRPGQVHDQGIAAAGAIRLRRRDDRLRHTSITQEIETALRHSRTLVAYYCRGFPQRYACQSELTAAYLAATATATGELGSRIIVLNPDDPACGHIRPASLADRKYAVPPAGRDRRGLDLLTADLAVRVRTVTGTFASIRFADRPRWFADRFPGTVGFVGRYADQWELHSALESATLPLTREVTHGPAAVLAGMPMIGKTELAAAYAWQFGTAHRGGVYWIDLAGATASGAFDRYRTELADRQPEGGRPS